MSKIRENFCNYLKNWKEYSFEGNVNDLAKMLDVSQGYMSNVLAGRRCGDEDWRRDVAKKIGVPYEEMISLPKDSDKKESSSKPIPMDPAIRIMEEALEETGIKINKKQKMAVIQIIREELAKSKLHTKDDIKKYLDAFGK